MLDKSHGHLGCARDRARRSSTGGWSRQRGAAPTRKSVSVATVRSPRSRARPAHRRRQHCRPRPRRADPSATGPGGRSCSPRSGQAQPVNRRPEPQFGQFPRMPGCVDVRIHEDELVISHVREAEPSLQRFGLFQGNARCLGPGRTRQGRSWTVGDRPRRDPRPPTAAPSRHPTGLSPDIASMRALGDMRPSAAFARPLSNLRQRPERPLPPMSVCSPTHPQGSPQQLSGCRGGGA